MLKQLNLKSKVATNATGATWVIYPTASGLWGVWDRDRIDSWKLNGTGC